MSEWATVIGYAALKCASCGDVQRGPETTQRRMWDALNENERTARARGWRLFVSRSGRRWYCADCGPSKGHRMHEVVR